MKRLSASLDSDQTGESVAFFFNDKNPVEWIKRLICYSVMRDFSKKSPPFNSIDWSIIMGTKYVKE